MQTIMKRLKRDKRAVSNAIVVMLSLVLVVIIVANVVLWSYQMNQLDWEKMQEDVKITDVARAGEAWSYNASGYAPSGSTNLVSGSVSNLTSNDGVYMVFRSYASATNTNNIVTNGNVTTATDWTYTDISDPSAVVSGNYSSTVYQSASYSLYIQLVDDSANLAYTGSGKQYQAMATVSTLPTSATLYFYYRIDCGGTSASAEVANATVTITKPDTSTVTVFTTSVTFAALTTGSWIYQTINVSSVFTATGTYTLDLRGYFSTTTAKKPTLTVYYDDVWLNIVTPSEYTNEVEFTGSSNTESWMQLVWTVDSAWTISSVNVTLQLFNYTLGDYPTSENGYIAYTSGDTPNTDETKNQTITVNPTDFGDATGYWRMKIKGVKATDTQFDFKVDWIEFKVVTDSGTLFTFENAGSLTSHVVSLWIINSTNHRRYDANLFINSGEEATYIRADIRLPSTPFIAKVVTERGNMAVFARS